MQNVEDQLGKIWDELLGCGEVGADADFFAQGGTSFGAVYLASMVYDNFGVATDASDVFTARTLGAFAALIAERQAEPDPTR